MPNSHRYYQPKNTKDAMRYIERLFNKYRNAPLTTPLLEYHNRLMRQLRTNIMVIAKRENIPARVKDAQRMYQIMNRWIQIRITGRRFPFKMRHFRTGSPHPHFKAHHIKISGNHNLRSSRH